jgi:surface-anchored protein
VPTVLSRGDIDIAVNYHPDSNDWELNLHSDELSMDFDPATTLCYAGPGNRLAQPSDPRYAFTGANPGDPIWVLTQTADLTDPKLNLSFANDGLPDGILATWFEPDPRINATGTYIKVSMIDVRGPGQFSLWQTLSDGTPVVWMSTAQTGQDNAYWIDNGGDSGLNLGFTATGQYQVDFQASAFLADGTPIMSEVVTWNFGVENDCGFGPGGGGFAPGGGHGTSSGHHPLPAQGGLGDGLAPVVNALGASHLPGNPSGMADPTSVSFAGPVGQTPGQPALFAFPQTGTATSTVFTEGSVPRGTGSHDTRVDLQPGDFVVPLAPADAAFADLATVRH